MNLSALKQGLGKAHVAFHHMNSVRVVFVPCYRWKCFPTAISSNADIPEVTGCHYYNKWFSERVEKLLQGQVYYYLSAYFSDFYFIYFIQERNAHIVASM